MFTRSLVAVGIAAACLGAVIPFWFSAQEPPSKKVARSRPPVSARPSTTPENGTWQKALPQMPAPAAGKSSQTVISNRYPKKAGSH